MSNQPSDAAATGSPLGAAGRTGKPAIQVWSEIVQTPQLVGYFEGVFAKAGIAVQETGEEFTAVHSGDAITFHEGIDRDVDFTVPLSREQVANLERHAAHGEFGPEESWRIVQALFTPLTRAALHSPTVRRNWLRVMAGVETLIHVHLLHPNGGDAATHTLAFAGDQWLVIPGLYGSPKRTYHLTADQALAFQRHLYAALKSDSMAGWWQFANWYREWRIAVSVRHDHDEHDHDEKESTAAGGQSS